MPSAPTSHVFPQFGADNCSVPLHLSLPLLPLVFGFLKLQVYLTSDLASDHSVLESAPLLTAIPPVVYTSPFAVIVAALSFAYRLAYTSEA